MSFNTVTLPQAEHDQILTALKQHSKNNDVSPTIHEVPKTNTLYNSLPDTIQDQLKQLQNGTIDHVIIHNLPLPDTLPPTPSQIRTTPQTPLITALLAAAATPLGTPSQKGIENTIRWEDNGETKQETWHSHPQFNYSLFYCMRGDPNADIYLARAGKIVENADDKTKDALITQYQYKNTNKAFALLNKSPNGYTFSPQIYTPSDLEEQIDDLDLPDVKKGLRQLRNNTCRDGAEQAINHILNELNTCDTKTQYEPGNLAIYNEHKTLRYSPCYKTSKSRGEERWLKATSIRTG